MNIFNEIVNFLKMYWEFVLFVLLSIAVIINLFWIISIIKERNRSDMILTAKRDFESRLLKEKESEVQQDLARNKDDFDVFK